MPKVIRNTPTDQTLGHCWPATTPLEGSQKVFANEFGIMRVGDSYNTHPGPCGTIPPHAVVAGGGSSNVFVEGLPIHRNGDLCLCGDIASNGSDTVFANGE